MKPFSGFSTLAVHGGEEAGPGPLEAPLVLSSAFGFASAEEAAGAFRGENDAYIYGRWGNPTVEQLEAKVAALEGAEAAAASASGMAAISGALLGLLSTGDHIVAPRAMYGEAARLLRERLPRLGVTTTFVDDTSPGGYEAAIGPATRLLYIETPANPTLAITDIAGVVEVARRRGLRVVADNTFATPYCQRPLGLGVDLVMHSMTKFLGGHGDAIGGVVAGGRELVDTVREATIKGFGGALSPFNAFLVARGLRTFALRMAQSTGTAARLAAFLDEHPAVERVHHPSLPGHPGYELARRQMRAPPGILSFEVRGGVEAGRRVLGTVGLVRHAVSLGDVRTLITHPASTTASTMPPADRARAGIGDGLLRLAVGIEDADDLEADLALALKDILMSGYLIVKGAKQHNLKEVSCRIPRDKLVVITGPSGSGKSSLAFDTIYAEGQRRYVESLSAYARQFLEQLSKPDVEAIEGLSPAIAIDQKAIGKSPRSTVGTVTEIADYLRLLYARVGEPHCPRCGLPIQAQTVQQIVDAIVAEGEGAKAILFAPIVRHRKGELKLELERLRREGFVRARVDGQLVDLGDDLVLDRQKAHDLDVMVDRLVLKEGVRGRVTDSVELALRLGEGVLLLDRGDGREPRVLSERFACVVCGVSLPPLEPRLFSFNGPHGACPACGGLGERVFIDPDRCVPERSRSLRDGALLCWGRRGSVSFATELTRAVEALGVDPNVPFERLPEEQQQALLHGAPARGKKKAYEGAVPRLTRLLDQGSPEGEGEEEPEDDIGKVGAEDVWRFCKSSTCDSCHGKRLRPEALAVKLGGKTIADLGSISLRNLRDVLRGIEAEGATRAARERAIAEPLLRAVVARLGFLIEVGLDYLALDRSTNTLSGGEGQRIRLATQIGAALVGVLYVLDEPSVGLHARDNERLLQALRSLVDAGNSVLVVEHDREAILAADYLIDMGPGAGVRGGQIVAEGTPAQVMQNAKSVTGPYLSGEKPIQIPPRRRPPGPSLRVVNARAHNLRGVTAEIPLGVFVCATGVSGSGKSSLIMDTLLPAARSVLYGASAPVGDCDRIEGLEHIDKVISIDQSPIGRTPRSNPATYTGMFTLLREHYASLPEARSRGYKAGRFSFNVKGGRCEACQGDGVLRVEMHFLPDVFVTCDACAGRRYGRETLEVLYRGLSIADALDLTVERALDLFEMVPRMRDKLVALRRVGLGYMPLGQPATTLSGGEAQRVKLARELARRATGRTLYVLDEPTTGLHFADIEQLMSSLNELCDAGNTVLIIEHNLDVVACADWVIDMGPEGGERGGLLVAEGTPEDIARSGTHTGEHLARVLASAQKHAKGKTKGKAKKS